ncbi:Bowman-Birk type wound-induced trypsin inhibitor-like [Neltuma alba]|uniref:Bowman-Birk type wound-induced trypsin inhibitor-like n=1 Tax=Neltuma alba TaxID=207710 RepID=UPI0010A4B641|nr:Bowman-Birk type wound-induced trypsin inhibitor-like [Prosopis alba]XP_028794472.1 Bowman-Birk type wound-induced trypsin inhibitor-like [Prosopis alba]
MGFGKTAMMMKVGVVLFLMAFTIAAVEARFDANTFLAEMFKDNGEPNYLIKSTTTACCNNCCCTKSNPPQCQCNDIGETCHSACKSCICALSDPPQCHCLDITTFCYPPCSSSSA